ncbi:hypothetical protein CWI36_0139p0020 [Hamiltosporidium magnivora]|uniref:C2H2-type domain-containing protein n=2 Tax=Hamiltosporidium magnivora TaxID=148818 RepID=A0A4Q9LJN9_9MICR|nr:hypothetical protein CWI36_0139p0020 [Hamiltosporidium magnivora]
MKLYNINECLENNQENIQNRRKMYWKTKEALRRADRTKIDLKNIEMIELLLNIEKNVYFKEERQLETYPEFMQRCKSNFLKDFICCNNIFTDFDTYVMHVQKYHQTEIEAKNQSSINNYENFQLLNYDFSNFQIPELNLLNEKPYFGIKKPYPCKVKGCYKSYKNPNGLKYHMIHHHSDIVKDQKENYS